METHRQNFKKMRVILTKEQEDLLFVGTVVVDKEGKKWYCLPFWFKKSDEFGTHYEQYSLEKLPEEFKKQLVKLKGHT